MMPYEPPQPAPRGIASSAAELQLCSDHRPLEGYVGASHGGSWSALAEVRRYVTYRGVRHLSVKV